MIKIIFLLGAVLAWQPAAAVETFPSRPVRIVVPYSISGPGDIQGAPRLSRVDRMVAQNAPPPISDVLAQIAVWAIQADSLQPVSFERLPGAATTRGANAVARAPSDGHTLLLASDGTMVINPQYFHGVEYDPARDFVPVAPLATMPFVLLARTGLPVATTRDLVAWLRRRPGEINYGSSGEGSTGNLVGELFARSARVGVVHVPFDGGIAALNGLVQGQVSFVLAAAPLALGHMPNRHFRPLAVSGTKRLEQLHDVGTFAEQGFPGVDAEGWYAIFAPAGTPPAVTAWLNGRIAQAVAEPATRARLIAAGLEPATLSLGRFAARVDAERAKWAPVLRKSRMSMEDGA
jgi:tripartite-type tricarboxylate transporter receptor subunit TctC